MKKFRGIFGILTAPFDQNYDLDLEDVKRQVEFLIKGGVHGIVVPVNASEYWTLSDEERMNFVQTAAETNAGRLPIVAGVTSQSTKVSLLHTRHAREVGVDAVIAAPPVLPGCSPVQMREYYKRIAGEADGIPVMLQNHTPPFGIPMSAALCMDFVKTIDGVEFVKEETQYSSKMITELNELGKDVPTYRGTFGGKACRYLLDEHNRGAIGCMPACQVADVMAQVWNLLDAGRKEEAQTIFNAAEPQVTFEFGYGVVAYKTMLKRRGVIKTTNFRGCGMTELDEKAMEESDRVYKLVEPYFCV